jgi:hypothetical protein
LALKGRRFDDIITIKKTIAGYTCKGQNAGLLQMLSTMAQILGLLYQVAKELLQREQHGIICRCHYFREKNTIQKFFDHTLYAINHYYPVHIPHELLQSAVKWTLA